MAFNPKYSVNLIQVFNRVFGGKPREVRRDMRKTVLTEQFKRDFGIRAIDKIVDRSKSGIDKNGKRFPGYSQSYISSLEFQIYGKSPGTVNLTLTGEMLASMEIRTTGRGLSIEMADQDNADKAHGIITGQQGKWGKRRDFLGLPQSDENEIMRRVMEINYSPSQSLLNLLSETAVGGEGGIAGEGEAVQLSQTFRDLFLGA